MEFAIVLPVVIGLVEAIKRAGLSSRYSPIVSILLGVVLMYLFGGDIWEGLLAGLSASGLYSGVKAQYPSE